MIKTESLLEELFDDSKNMVLVTDERFSIRYISSNVETIFGVKPYSLLGKNAFEFAPADKREIWQSCIQQSLTNKSSEISLKTISGKELYFEITFNNHVNHNEIRGVVIFLHDITERKLAHKELIKTNDHLDHFIFKTMHDLQAPLHSALGLMDLAESSKPSERDHYLKMIKASLQRLDAFIIELNSFFKNEKLAIQNELVDLESIFHEELTILQNMPDASGIKIEFFCDAQTSLYSDVIRLKTILTNILSNAIKYSDRQKDNRFIKVKGRVSEGKFNISIEDNGLGIESQYLSKIFDMYFRAHTGLKGTGLGLYIVKDTIDRLNGTIEVTSEPGKGTSFYIELPNFVTIPLSSN